MNLRGRIPVEPLDDERVVRVERAVVAGYADAMARGARGGLRRWVPTLAIAAVAAAAAVVVMWKLRPVPETEAVVAAPVRIEATARGSRVDLGDAAIDVAPGAAFVVTRPDGGVLITLDGGLIELQVASRKGRAPLVVRTADIDVTVVGTRFSVERGADVSVTVTEGIVQVQRGGKQARVAAGQRWAAPAQVAAGQDAFPAVTAIAVAANGPDTIASGDIETADRGSVPALRDHSAAVPTVERDADRDRGGSGSDSGHRDRDRDRARGGSGSDSGSGSISSLDLFQDVRAHRPSKPADGGSPQYADAYEQYFTNRDSRAASRSIDVYMARTPRGPELRDVLWLRIRLLCKDPIDETCRKAANTYLGKFPVDDDGGRKSELATLIKNKI